MSATDQQWELLLEKYEKLLWKIAHNISGDNAISSLEDNYQDLCIAAMDAIRGFEKKEGRKFDEFWGEKGFDKYIKTCLWNLKNSKGAKITKRYPITRKTVSTYDNDEILEVPSGTGAMAIENSVFVREMKKLLTEEQSFVVTTLIQDPSMVKPNGKVNISKLSKKLDLSWGETSRLVESVASLMRNDL